MEGQMYYKNLTLDFNSLKATIKEIFVKEES